MIIDKGVQLVPIEIKASETISSTFFRNLTKWNELSETSAGDNFVVYAGTENQKRAKGAITGWKSSATLIKKIYK